MNIINNKNIFVKFNILKIENSSVVNNKWKSNFILISDRLEKT
jgi:hypothetical protein